MSATVAVWHDARMSAALTFALALAVAAGAYAGQVVLGVAVLATQAVLIWGWHRALDVPGATGGMVVGAAAALAADVLLLVRDDARPLSPVAGLLGVAMLAVLVHQLVRRPVRARLTPSLAATATLVVLAVLAALFIPAADTRGGEALVAVTALAAALAAAAGLLPLAPVVLAGVATAGGALLGAVVAALTDPSVGPTLLLGAASAAVAVSMAAFVRRVPRPDLTTVAALPVVGVAPLGYVLGRILVG